MQTHFLGCWEIFGAGSTRTLSIQDLSQILMQHLMEINAVRIHLPAQKAESSGLVESLMSVRSFLALLKKSLDLSKLRFLI